MWKDSKICGTLTHVISYKWQDKSLETCNNMNMKMIYHVFRILPNVPVDIQVWWQSPAFRTTTIACKRCTHLLHPLLVLPLAMLRVCSISWLRFIVLVCMTRVYTRTMRLVLQMMCKCLRGKVWFTYAGCLQIMTYKVLTIVFSVTTLFLLVSAVVALCVDEHNMRFRKTEDLRHTHVRQVDISPHYVTEMHKCITMEVQSSLCTTPSYYFGIQQGFTVWPARRTLILSIHESLLSDATCDLLLSLFQYDHVAALLWVFSIVC